MQPDAKIYVAGHRGMVGSAIVEQLQQQGYRNLLTRTHAQLDLTRQQAVESFFRSKSRNMFSWQQPGWGASEQIPAPRQIFFIRT